jgi:hypothetical protein
MEKANVVADAGLTFRLWWMPRDYEPSAPVTVYARSMHH